MPRLNDAGVKKIAVLLPNLTGGGAERLVLEELSFLRRDPRLAFEVHLVFEKGVLYDKVAQLGLPVHVWGATHRSLRMLKTCWDISSYLRRDKFDILHCHLFDHIGPYIAKLAGVKAVATVHLDARYGFFIKNGMRRCDLVLGCGKEVVNNISQFVSAEKIRQLNNGISPIASLPNMAAHKADVFKKLSIGPDSRIILSLGRLTRQKGFDILISAFQALARRVPNVVLLIGGEGEMRISLQDQIAASNLQNKVKLLGFVENVDDMLALCEVYVNSSRFEGLPMTLLEAMAHGKPIVATDVGGNSEVIWDGKTGLLVPSEAPEPLGEAIARILTDKALKERLGVDCHDLFISKYTIDTHCKELSTFYLQLTAGHL